jgi:hypothetical protein
MKTYIAILAILVALLIHALKADVTYTTTNALPVGNDCCPVAQLPDGTMIYSINTNDLTGVTAAAGITNPPALTNITSTQVIWNTNSGESVIVIQTK